MCTKTARDSGFCVESKPSYRSIYLYVGGNLYSKVNLVFNDQREYKNARLIAKQKRVP